MVAPIVVALIGSHLPSGRYRAADLIATLAARARSQWSTMLAAQPNTHFESPEDHTATEPPELVGLRRDGVRLMVATPASIRHTFFNRLGDQLSAGDVLVVNTSATVPGQLDGNRDGAAVVVHIANRLGDGTRVVELRTAPDASAPVLDGGSEYRQPLLTGAYWSPSRRIRSCERRESRIQSAMREQLNRTQVHDLAGNRLCADGHPAEQHLGIAGACTADQLRLPQWLVPHRRTRRSSHSAQAARRCPAQPGRSVPNWSLGWWHGE